MRFTFKQYGVTAVLLLGLALVIGCSSKSDNAPGGGGGGPATTRTMLGIMINSNENGRLSITIQSPTFSPQGATRVLGPTPVAASATFQPIVGGPVSLTGTYDTVTDSLSLMGGGYTLGVTIETDDANPGFATTYTGPNGPGFAGAIRSDSLAMLIFCGTWSSSTTSFGGAMGFLVADTMIAGIAFPDGATDPIFIEGTSTGSGTSRTIMVAGSESGVYDLSITGTYNTLTSVINGTWQYDDLVGPSQDNGTFSATPCP